MADRPLDLARDHPAAAVGFALLLLLSGALLGFDAAREPVRERTLVEDVRWTENAAYTYSVPITRNATVWPNGTRLPMGEPAYFRSVTDRIDVDFAWRPSEGARGLAQAGMALHVRAETPSGRVYWAFSQELADAPMAAAEDGLVLNASIDLDALVANVSTIATQLPIGDGRINVTVETVVTYAVTAASREESGSSSYRFPIQLNDPRFVLPAPQDLASARRHSDTRHVVTERPAGWDGALASLPAVGLVLAGVAGVAGTLWAVRSDPARGAREADEADYLREQERFREWITPSASGVDPGTLPANVVDVPTLEDLVRVSAEARTRVVLDPTSRIYYALLPNVAYRYARHAPVLPVPGRRRPPATRRPLL